MDTSQNSNNIPDSLKVANAKSVKQLIHEEYMKCAIDPIHFMSKYCFIQHPKRGKIPFVLYPFQKDALNQIRNNQYNIILKSRQLGISTLVSAYALWLMTFSADKNILCISIKQEDAKDLVTKVRVMHQNLPSWLKNQCIEDNKLSMRFKNGSRIKAESSSPDAGRGGAVSLLIIDEAAFIDHIDTIWAAAQQTLATGGDCIVLSCVVGDTYIYTDNGVKQIKDFSIADTPGDYKINEYNILGKNTTRTGNLFKNSGITDTIKIITKHGELEGSKIHKLWAYSVEHKKYDWYKLEQLKKGDYVSMQIGSELWGNNDTMNFKYSRSNKIKTFINFSKITPELAYLFGLYISEGNIYKVLNKKDNTVIGGNLNITCGDKEITWVFDKLNLHYTCHDGLHYTVSSKILIELFEYIGFDVSTHAHKKIIPDRLLEMSRENIIYLLRGIFDGDGCAYNGKVSLTSSSYELIKQVRALLINFGIASSYFYNDKDDLNSYSSTTHKFNYDSHVIEIYGKNALTYFNKIGFCLNRKQKKYKLLLKQNFNRATSHNIIPDSLELIKKLKLSSNMKIKQINKITGYRLGRYCNKKTKYKTSDISKEVVISFYELLKNNLSESDVEYWDKIVDQSLNWVKIKDIEYNKNITYDVSLPETDDFWCHSVIYNGFLGHQTPNGVGGFFHRTWVSAETQNPDAPFKFNPIRLRWDMHPERDQTWRDAQDIALGVKLAAQECDTNFNTSGDSVVPPEIIEFYEKTFIQEPIEKRGIENAYWIWQYPDYTKNYVVSVDVARGDGGDYSAFHVLNIETLEQVAEYKGKIGTKEFGNLCVTVATEYNNALLVIENANVGWAVIQEAIDKNYQNIFYSNKDLTLVDSSISLKKRYDLKEKSQLVAGFSTTMRTKPLIISKMDMYLREQSVIIRSKRLTSELYTYIYNGSRTEAMTGYNDDLVMAYAIGLWVRDTAIRLKQEGIEMQKASLAAINKVNPVMMPNEPKNNPWKLKVGKQEEDITWLI